MSRATSKINGYFELKVCPGCNQKKPMRVHQTTCSPKCRQRLSRNNGKSVTPKRESHTKPLTECDRKQGGRKDKARKHVSRTSRSTPDPKIMGYRCQLCGRNIKAYYSPETRKAMREHRKKEHRGVKRVLWDPVYNLGGDIYEI